MSTRSQARLPTLVALTTLVACTAAWSATRFLSGGLLARAENATIDSRFHIRGPRVASARAAIIGLDDATRSREPALFARREVMATLVSRLAAAHPSAIALDLFYDRDEELIPPSLVVSATKALAGLAEEPHPSSRVVAARDALASIVDVSRGDQRLAAAVSSAGNVVLASFFGSFAGPGDGPVKVSPPSPALLLGEYDESVGIPALGYGTRPRQARSFIADVPPIGTAAARAGFVVVHEDEYDDTVRALDAAIEYDGHLFLPISLAALAVDTTSGTAFLAGDDGVRVGPWRVPVEPRARVQVDFYGPKGAIPHFSAADVLEGRVPEKELEGRFLFVGFTDVLRDVVRTPFDPAMPGVEVHATMAANVLGGTHLRPWSDARALAALILLGLVAVALVDLSLRVRPELCLVALLAVVAGWAVAAQIAFDGGTILPLVTPASVAFATGAAGLVVRFGQERSEKKFLRRTFTQYVSEAVVEQLLDDPARAGLGGERRELTFLFSDIRGFSHIAENLEPAKLTTLLGEYFGPMSEIVQREGGTLDKYIGDAVMAFWGAPLDVPDHAARAARAALAMMRSLQELNPAWRARGLPEIRIGIGLNTGTASVGNMGSATRVAYTALGDAVNLASRLESLTKEFGASILATEETVAKAGPGFHWRELDRVQVAGREGATNVFQLLGTGEVSAVSRESVAWYESALAAYRRRDWQAAEEGFAAVLAADPDDSPAAVMRDRTRALRVDPPPPSWDGVYRQRSK